MREHVRILCPAFALHLFSESYPFVTDRLESHFSIAGIFGPYLTLPVVRFAVIIQYQAADNGIYTGYVEYISEVDGVRYYLLNTIPYLTQYL